MAALDPSAQGQGPPGGPCLETLHPYCGLKRKKHSCASLRRTSPTSAVQGPTKQPHPQSVGERVCAVEQQFPTFLTPGTGFVEDNFSMDRGGGGWWLRDASSALHLLCTLFLLLLHCNI